MKFTLAQRRALGKALISYVEGQEHFHGPQSAGLTLAHATQIAARLIDDTYTCCELDLLKLLPRMPYTVPEGAERGTYFRALHAIGALLDVPKTMADFEKVAGAHDTKETVLMIADAVNPAPKDPRVYAYGGYGVDVKLVDMRSTERIFWSAHSNSYVMAANPTGPFQDRSGRHVDLVSVNGIGEKRWVVQKWEIDSDQRGEAAGHPLGDGEDRLAAARYFGLISPAPSIDTE